MTSAKIRLYDYDVKLPNATFYEGRKRTMTNFHFLFLNLNKVLKNSTLGEIAHFLLERFQIDTIKFGRTQILFLATFSLPPPSMLL